MSSYCTLFDKNYLDKGLVMIDSLRKYNECAKLYVLAMDEICYECMVKVGINGVVPIRLIDFETSQLLEAKNNRSRGEYCWTCASNLVKYIFETYSETYCTYIDADLCFYGNPDLLISEMIEAGKSVQIIEHRFRQDFSGKFQQKISGRFCVQFNTFKNDEWGRDILNVWCKQTLEQCKFSFGLEKLGDQMYLDEWPEKYGDIVNVLQNMGAGVAPWNLDRYTFLKEDESGIWLKDDKKKTPIRLVFFHFHGMNYIDRNRVDIKVHKRFWRVDMALTRRLYEPYLKMLDDKKEWIENKFGFLPLVQGNALGIVNRKSLRERVKNLFKGNAYENIRFRVGNHLKILLFGMQDIIQIKK